MNAIEMWHDVREAMHSRRGRSLMWSVLAGLLAVQAAVMVPMLLRMYREQVQAVVTAESARVDALLQKLPPDWALDHVASRPLLLGLVVVDASGRTAASTGFTDFDQRQLAGPGAQRVDGDGVVDVGFDVRRREGTWRVMLRCYTRPAEQALLLRTALLGLLGLFAVAVAVVLTVFFVRRKIMLPLEHQARHDSLTGLPNRAHFDSRLREVIGDCLRDGKHAALLFIDLDRFKDFNDNFGHPQGDALLVEIARRVNGAVATDCVAARIGGDEFAVILTYVHTVAEARTQAEQILETLSRPYRYNQFHFQLSASIGVAMLPEQGATPADAQRNADIAMYVSKRGGRARVTVFDGAMSEAVSRRKQVEDWLRVAIERDELTLHYQPKLNMDGTRVEGAEALLRWTRPDGLKLAPAEFIPVAEESGLIVPLGSWVLKRVLAQVAEWRAQGFDPPRISVNVSANQFLDEDFLGAFLAILGEGELPARHLDLEITESALITTPAHAVQVLHQLRAKGITVSLDDFGTGYSSLSYLKRFTVNTIKIDHSFVADLATDHDSAMLVKAVIRLTHSLGLTFVAEGVETHEQLELLRQWGCDQYQGHVTSPAIPAEAFRAFCRDLQQSRAAA